jgi:hypothetical protein
VRTLRYFALYAITSPAAKFGGVGRSSLRFCLTHSSARLLLSSALILSLLAFLGTLTAARYHGERKIF